jgi:hypothetical protein
MSKFVVDVPDPVKVKPVIEFQSPDMLIVAEDYCIVVKVPPVNEFQLFISILISESSDTVNVLPEITLFPYVTSNSI